MIYHLFEWRQPAPMRLAGVPHPPLCFTVLGPRHHAAAWWRGSSCQFASGPLFVLLVVSVMWPVEFLLVPVGAKQLVRQKSLTALWFSCLSDGPAKAEPSDLHSLEKKQDWPRLLVLPWFLFYQDYPRQGSGIDKHRKLEHRQFDLKSQPFCWFSPLLFDIITKLPVEKKTRAKLFLRNWGELLIRNSRLQTKQTANMNSFCSFLEAGDGGAVVG